MSVVFVVMLLVEIVSLNVTAIVVSGELLVELIVGLTEDIVGNAVVVLAPNFS